jgi:hypothetical protein
VQRWAATANKIPELRTPLPSAKLIIERAQRSAQQTLSAARAEDLKQLITALSSWTVGLGSTAQLTT